MDVTTAMTTLGETSQGLVTTRLLKGAGVHGTTLARAVQAGTVLRVRPGVYSLTALPKRPTYAVTDTGVHPDFVALVRAELLSLGPRFTAVERTAALLWGWGLLEEPRTLEFAVKHGRGSVVGAGAEVVQRRHMDRGLLRVLPGTDGVLVTAAVQTAVDCARSLTTRKAVVVADSALRSGKLTLEELATAIAACRVPGAARARRVLARCDPACGSVLESVFRDLLIEARIAGWATQVVVQDTPVVVRVDFCWTAERLVVEVDGARWHPYPAVDRARDNVLASLGWRVLRFTWAEVMYEASAVLDDVRAALGVTQTLHDPVAAALGETG